MKACFDLVPEMSVKLVFKESDLYVLTPTNLINRDCFNAGLNYHAVDT